MALQSKARAYSIHACCLSSGTINDEIPIWLALIQLRKETLSARRLHIVVAQSFGEDKLGGVWGERYGRKGV